MQTPPQPSTTPPQPSTTPARHSRWPALGLLAAVVAALWLRLDGLGERMLSHPENFAPGLELPGWLSFPPPRHDLLAVLKGTLIDGHPPTFFIALLAWTKLFGASLVSLRMPSALLGAASVVLVYRIARREGGPALALLAAALVALNGHHIYWSQMARMYVPVSFLGLLSTLFLLRMHERREGLRGEQAGYLAATVAALWTQLYAWPLVFAQLVATTVRALRTGSAPVALRTQLIAIMLGLPVVQLSIFQNPPSRWHQPSAEYFGFGYLFDSRAPFFGHPPELPYVGGLSIALGAILLISGAWAARGGLGERAAASAAPPAARRRLEWGAALSLTLALGGFALYSLHYSGVAHGPIALVACLPIAAVLAFGPLERRAQALAARPPAWLSTRLPELPLSLILAILPVLCMLAVSTVRGAYVARGTVVFQPYFAIAAAHGVCWWLRPRPGLRLRPAGLAVLASVLVLHVVSAGFHRSAQSSRRDYAGLAGQIAAELQPADRILVQDDFGYPPFIYYLRHAADQMVHTNYKRALFSAPAGTRFWMVHLTEHELPGGMRASFEGLTPERELEAFGMRGLLFRRPRNWPRSAVDCREDSAQLGPGPGELLQVAAQVQLDHG